MIHPSTRRKELLRLHYISARLSRLPHLETRSYTLLEPGHLSQATMAEATQKFTLGPVVKLEGEHNLKI